MVEKLWNGRELLECSELSGMFPMGLNDTDWFRVIPNRLEWFQLILNDPD